MEHRKFKIDESGTLQEGKNWVDEYGVVFSEDKTKLLKSPNGLKDSHDSIEKTPEVLVTPRAFSFIIFHLGFSRLFRCPCTP